MAVDPALAWSDRLSIEVGGVGTVAQAGVALPRLLADRLGLTGDMADVLAWPKRVQYRNLRHHCATWWNNELGTSWQQVALQLGNSYKTVLEHYVLTSAGDRAAALSTLAKVELPGL